MYSLTLLHPSLHLGCRPGTGINVGYLRLIWLIPYDLRLLLQGIPMQLMLNYMPSLLKVKLLWYLSGSWGDERLLWQGQFKMLAQCSLRLHLGSFADPSAGHSAAGSPSTGAPDIIETSICKEICWTACLMPSEHQGTKHIHDKGRQLFEHGLASCRLPDVKNAAATSGAVSQTCFRQPTWCRLPDCSEPADLEPWTALLFTSFNAVQLPRDLKRRVLKGPS